MIEELIQVFGEIENNSSKIIKENLVREHYNVEGFTEVLNFVYNPFIVTGLAKKKMAKNVAPKESQITTLTGIMNYVEFNNTGSDEVIAVVKGFLEKLNGSEEINFVESVLTKDLKVGITSKTINKAFAKTTRAATEWGTFIPEYNVMLANKFEDYIDKLKGAFQVSLKLDGIRCTVFNTETGPKLFSRKGLPIEGMVELEQMFENLPTGYVYDGELIAFNPENLTSDDLFRYTQKIVRKDGVKTGVQFWAFDMLPISEFYSGKSAEHLNKRALLLTDVVENLKTTSPANGKYIEMVPVYYVGEDKEIIYKILEEVTNNGYEGLMVSPLNSYYETKRSRSLLKVKKFHTIDLRIVGMEEHKHGNKLGSLVVDYKGYTVNVGSGFSDSERMDYWTQNLIGEFVEVGYFEESNNEAGGLSLRFPTFKRLRFDKNEPSYS